MTIISPTDRGGQGDRLSPTGADRRPEAAAVGPGYGEDGTDQQDDIRTPGLGHR